jgi:HD-GYP domain-containing protein (c-di-GMP phosphodiesterase class II)
MQAPPLPSSPSPAPSTREFRYRRLIELGIALSSERHHERLMQTILLGAKELTHADGGTLYKVAEDRSCLHFEIVLNDTLEIAMGGTTGVAISLPPVRLYKEQGEPNHTHISACCALTGTTIAIEDAYDASRFDFSGTRAFDERTGYRSRSFLNVPLKNREGEVTGVLQLINARDPQGEVVAFASDLVPLIEALASQAAVALENQQLIDAQKTLFAAFIELIAGAIDAKSVYTGNHCRRVPVLTKMLTKAAVEATEGPFADFTLNEDEWYELEIASGLHDCGKVTTPEYVVDKATKLETIYNRVHEIRTRFEVVKRDVEIDYLKGVLAGGEEVALAAERDRQLRQLDDDFAFVAECNLGGEVMAPAKIERLQRIASIPWTRTLDDTLGLSWEEALRMPRTPTPLPVVETLLADKPHHIVEHDQPPLAPDNPWGFTIKTPTHKFNLGELYNLSISRGTLTAEERFHINNHIVQTIIMLEALPFPKSMQRVPELAGGHHEKMDGTGYPKGLTREQMSIPARIMAIADIFEALTACDRPYRKAKTLSQVLAIMARMKQEDHIDPDLYELFVQSGVYRQYAAEFLQPEQIDEVVLPGRAQP